MLCLLYWVLVETSFGRSYLAEKPFFQNEEFNNWKITLENTLQKVYYLVENNPHYIIFQMIVRQCASV